MKNLGILQGTAVFIFLMILSVSGFAQENKTFNKPIRFAVLGDRTGSAQEGIYEQIVTEIQRLRPDFVTTVGDMVEGPTTDSAEYVDKWNEYNGIVSQFTMPLFLAPGNNDIYSDFEERMYYQVIGQPYHSVNYENIHMIMLDNGRWSNVENFTESDNGATQIEWLINDLEQNKDAAVTMVFFHVPYWYNTVADGKEDSLHTLFVKYGVDAVFSGHYHAYFSGEYDGIKYTNLGSSGGGASADPTGLLFHFAWVTIDNEGIHIAPIKINSVLPWEQVTAEERKLFNSMSNMGMSFKSPLMVNIDNTITDSEIALVLDNSYSDFELNDTIVWNVPDGWNITPESMPVQVAGGEMETFYFKASCIGEYFPSPSAEVNFTFGEGKTVEANGILRVAQQTNSYPRPKSFKIDGEISEKCWHDPVEQLFNYDGSEMTVEPVKYYFAYDEEHLYLAAHCEDSHVDSIIGRVTERDGPIYGEDCVGYFIEPSLGSDTLYQIYFNSLGTVFDAQYEIGPDGYARGGRDWNGEYKIKTRKGETFWSIEIQIPLKQFGVSLKEGDKMKVNFRRKHKRLNAASDWQVPLEYDPSTWGILHMR